MYLPICRHLVFIAALLGVSLAAVSVLAGSPALPASSQPDFVLAIMGQSNALGTNPLGPSPLLLAGAREEHVAWCFYPDRQWAVLQDPYSGGVAYYSNFQNNSAGASIAPGLARRLMPVVGNVAIIPAAVSGSSISAWNYRPTGGMSYLDKAVAQVAASGQVPNLALWWQGETDAKPVPGKTEAQWLADLTLIAARVHTEWGCPLMVVTMQTNDPTIYSNQGVIQQAQRNAPSVVPYVISGPDLSDILTAPENAVHLAHPAKIDMAAARWADAILAWRALQ